MEQECLRSAKPTVYSMPVRTSRTSVTSAAALTSSATRVPNSASASSASSSWQGFFSDNRFACPYPLSRSCALAQRVV
ncbi:hypothetical protein L596_027606 [Steinernema carpocapsae]|uniref:Uncharacterized protein n=1 Tax=Steinernema carpocapsae TaxID=34508 RepID=A0A4U5LW04_STECR|nr:hypothetical protein L596_027606 [Steinernema carpocapsae]